jgi:hypothetical protein
MTYRGAQHRAHRGGAQAEQEQDGPDSDDPDEGR